MRIELDNAQSGGPVLSIFEGEQRIAVFYLRDETYFRIKDGENQFIKDLPLEDGIKLYPEESETEVVTSESQSQGPHIPGFT